MPTPKQVRSVMKRIYYHKRKLAKAIWDAKDLRIIVAEPTDTKGNPGAMLFNVEYRIEEMAESALANAMRTEIMKGMKS